jgi:hypothetical protein
MTENELQLLLRLLREDPEAFRIRTRALQSPVSEHWDLDLFPSETREILRLREQFTGNTEAHLLATLGAPDDSFPGGSSYDASGKLVFRADVDHRYYRLLPHAVVSFEVGGGLVHGCWWYGKWRTCEPDQIQRLGFQYAPD